MPTPTYVVIFRRNELQLRDSESTQLRRWMQALAPTQRHQVVIGCCPDTAHEARQPRLRHLQERLTRIGVPPGRIRLSRECNEPPVRTAADDLPQDVFWLSLVKPADAKADPEAAAAAHERRSTCTKES